MEVIIEDIPVMYVVSADGPKGSSEAFKALENAINWQLKGRKFYGAMKGKTGEYRSCLAIIDPDEPKKLGFPTWTIPGGKYYRHKIADWEKHLTEIGRVCDEIIQKVRYDETRPVVEFYRSLKELFLFVPVQ